MEPKQYVGEGAVKTLEALGGDRWASGGFFSAKFPEVIFLCEFRIGAIDLISKKRREIREGEGCARGWRLMGQDNG